MPGGRQGSLHLNKNQRLLFETIKSHLRELEKLVDYTSMLLIKFEQTTSGRAIKSEAERLEESDETMVCDDYPHCPLCNKGIRHFE